MAKSSVVQCHGYIVFSHHTTTYTTDTKFVCIVTLNSVLLISTSLGSWTTHRDWVRITRCRKVAAPRAAVLSIHLAHSHEFINLQCFLCVPLEVTGTACALLCNHKRSTQSLFALPVFRFLLSFSPLSLRFPLIISICSNTGVANV